MLELKPLVIYSLALVIPVLYLTVRHFKRPTRVRVVQPPSTQPLKPIMQAVRDDLAPPKDDPYTVEELKEYDGTNPSKPIYVAIKGTIFDVTHKGDVYGPGRSYHIFAGKDGSRGLGMSSLKPEHAVSDYSALNEHDMKVLDDWHGFFSKRYNIVGRVVDLPTANM